MVAMTERRDFNRIRERLDETRTLARTMRTEPAMVALTRLGSALRQRYENECSYEWANTPAYEAETERLERNARAIADKAGLYLYLQMDPRGATVYVSGEPIADNNYNRSGAYCLYFKGKDY